MSNKLNIQVGQRWRTRSGDVATIVEYSADRFPQPWVIVLDGELGERSVNDLGYEFSIENPSWLDLIELIELIEDPNEPTLILAAPSALDVQIGGTHYKDMAVQPWEAFDSWLSKEQHAGYLLGTAIAYLARYNSTGAGKGGLTDVEKAIHTLQRMVEVVNAKS